MRVSNIITLQKINLSRDTMGRKKNFKNIMC